jgi:hypothetical protein
MKSRAVSRWISGRNVDVFDLAVGRRYGDAVCLEAFEMKLDGFSDEEFSFSHGGGGDASW